MNLSSTKGLFPILLGEMSYFCHMKRWIFGVLTFVCCQLSAQGVTGERLAGDVTYYEEETYSLVFIRLYSGTETLQTLRRAQNITCHEFDANGRETRMTEYTQRDANIGSLTVDGSTQSPNGIRRDNPARTVAYEYSESGLSSIYISKDSITDTLFCERLDRNGSYRAFSPNGKASTYRYDLDHCLVRYSDSESMTVRYTYNDRGHLIRSTTEWNDASSQTVTYDSYQYDEYGNWTSRIKNEKSPGESPRPIAIEERRYRYSSDSSDSDN